MEKYYRAGQTTDVSMACLVTKATRKVSQSHYRPEVPRGFREVKVPRLRDNGTGWC